MPGAVSEVRAGKWRLADLSANLPAPSVTAFEALRRSMSAEGVDRGMCAHFVARTCCASEAAACAAAAPPGGTAAYRDWRDLQCAAVVDRCMRQLADAAIAQQAPTPLAAETCAAARSRALAAAQDADRLVGRWMSFSEAESFVETAACAAAAAACVCTATDAAGKQHVLDMLDAVMRLDLARPVNVESPDARLAAFFMIHDALVVSMTNDPIDAHPSPTRITTSDGRPVVAVRAKRGGPPPQIANRLRWQSIAKMRAALVSGAVLRKVRNCNSPGWRSLILTPLILTSLPGPTLRVEDRAGGSLRLYAADLCQSAAPHPAGARIRIADAIAGHHPAVRQTLPAAHRHASRCLL